MSSSHSFSLSQNKNDWSDDSTLAGLLRERAAQHAGMPAYTFLADGEDEELTLTFDEVDSRARAIAAQLQLLKVEGERVLLVYPQGPEFVAAFYGCLFAGAIAVPVQPPVVRAERNESLSRFQAIADDCRPAAILSTAALLSKLEQLAGSMPWLGSAERVATDEIDIQMANEWQDPEIAPTRLALLQYTSGSTAAPKGVMVSHRNLLANSDYIDYGFQHDAGSVSLNWLPYFHDMGLINGIIQPVFKGFRCYIMSPTSFLQSPFRWLKAISRYRVTHSGGPNFAYELCLRKITPEQRLTLDLSSWAVAFSGAEPVRRDTLENFAASFAPCGFRSSAFYPAYGLAEGTLKVSGGRRDRGASFFNADADALEKNLVIERTESDGPARSLVGCGEAGRGTTIVIAHPESRVPCSPNEIGEIWVSGPSVAAGYWNRPEESSRVFEAYLNGSDEGPFLRTGDLGFLKENELFVTGRIKDLIIIRGLNHYPQDIELTVERSHPTLRRGGGASFSIDLENEERLVVVQEQDFRQEPRFQEAIDSIRRAVAENHEVQAHAVILIKPGTLPKTTSGKVQRSLCRSQFLAGALDIVAEWRAPVTPPAQRSLVTDVALQSADAIAEWLGSMLAAKIGVDRLSISLDQPLALSGLDSLTAIELLHDVQATLGVVLSVTDLLDSPNLRVLAEHINASREVTGLPPFDKGPLVGLFPLSLGQQSLWFLHQMAPQSAAYNISFAARIVSELDVAALHRALQFLVDRHPALRTTFESSGGSPVQRVHGDSSVSFEAEDALSWTDAELRARLVEEAQRPCDLANGPLFKVRLFGRGAAESILLVLVHHIAADLWSLALLLGELGAAYSAERRGLRPQLEPLSLQYTDYVRWESMMLAGDEGDRLSAYWRRELADAPTVLDLPSTRVRPRVQSMRGARRVFTLGSELTEGIKRIGAERGATLYMTLLSLLQALIYRYTGRTDFLIGSPTSGRRRQETSGMIGYFVIPQALRADLSGEPAFTAILERTRQTVLDALAHDQYPFPLVVKEIQVERDPARSPVFQVLFVLQKVPPRMEESLVSFAVGADDAVVQLGDLALAPITIDQQAAQFDLALNMAEIQGRLVGSLEYSVDLFDEAQMERMAGHFQRLVESVVANPEQPVSQSSLLSEAEHLRLLEWGETATSFGRRELLHLLFEEQVESSPDAIALVFQDQAITYRELNDRANQLASLLIVNGVGPDVVAGVLMERSAELVVALIGILKAGGAYLPLDPGYPPDRLSFMVEDSHPGVLLTQPRFRDLIAPAGVRIFTLDGECEVSGGAGDDQNPSVDLAGDNIAYVIYTSGTTGRPKGVMNTHRGICNRLLWMQAAYGLNAGDVVLQKTPFTFDVSVWEFFWPLITGARLVLARPGGHQDSSYLRELISAQGVTTLHFVPSMLRVFLENKSN